MRGTLGGAHQNVIWHPRPLCNNEHKTMILACPIYHFSMKVKFHAMISAELLIRCSLYLCLKRLCKCNFFSVIRIFCRFPVFS